MSTLRTDHGTFGLTEHATDPDGQNGYVRGVTTDGNGGYMALTGVQSKHFKTLRGAVAWLNRRGYDAYGRSAENRRRDDERRHALS